ncbi:MAG TPA: hypothetical protein VFI95_00130 [Terriglobales bacterium]|nr:hypothetical protein [Terriglobales bacterium]
MSATASSITTWLWMAQPVLELVVAIGLIYRKTYRMFPAFVTYVFTQIATFAILYPISLTSSYQAYFYAYWITAVISLVLGFKVIHEIFLDVFRPYHTLKDLGTVLFKWAGLVMLLVAGIVTMSGQSWHMDPLAQGIATLQRSMRVVQCGMILFLLLFSRYLGVSWQQKSFGIALGFGGFATCELAVIGLRAGGHISGTTMNVVNTGSYVLAICVWVVYTYMKDAKREAPVTLLKSQRWEQSLNEIQHPATPDSLIPLFEGMVERAFSRNTGEYPDLLDREHAAAAEKDPQRPAAAAASASKM